jgi:antibiotic biosynthesis monooxygenase (ABM) superfamily enzyme
VEDVPHDRGGDPRAPDLVSTLLRTLDADWSTFFRSAVTIVPVVALMTWVAMPRLSRLLRRWLYPDRTPPRSTESA